MIATHRLPLHRRTSPGSKSFAAADGTASRATTAASNTARMPVIRRTRLPGSLDGSLEQLLGDVEVRVDALDVVVLLQPVEQAHDLARHALVLDLHRRLRQHRRLGVLDRVPGVLERPPDDGELLGRADDAEAGAVTFDVFGTRVGR